MRKRSDWPAEAPAPISHRLWQSRYAADPAVLGRTIELSQRAYEMVGVLPPGIRFPFETDLWAPIHGLFDAIGLDSRSEFRQRRWNYVIGRLAPGVDFTAASAEMETIGARLEATHPAANKGMLPRLSPLRDAEAGPLRPLSPGPFRRLLPGAPHRLRQRGESAAGPQPGAAAGACDPYRHRRLRPTSGAPAAHRESPALGGGRSLGRLLRFRRTRRGAASDFRSSCRSG